MRRCCRFPRSRFGFCQSCDVDFSNLHWIVRAIIAGIGCFARDLLHQFNALWRALPEDRVMPVQMRRGYLRDKELRAVGVWSGVRHRKSAGDIEVQIWREFIFKAVARTAFASSFRIASLNHEIRNHAMKDRPVVERDAMLFLVRFGIRPVLRAGREANEVLDRLRRLFREKLAGEVTCGSVNDCLGIRGRRSLLRRAVCVSCAMRCR